MLFGYAERKGNKDRSRARTLTNEMTVRGNSHILSFK